MERGCSEDMRGEMLSRNLKGGSRVKKIHTCTAAAICISLLVFVLCAAYDAQAARSIFTIQAGSYKDIPDAQQQFESIARDLDNDDLAYLRIEKIGKFYTVRIGKFNDRAGAEQFLGKHKAVLSGAIVMDAYFKDERIERLYEVPPSGEIPSAPETLSPDTGAESVKPAARESDLRDSEDDIIPETVEGQIKKISALVSDQNYEQALRLTEAAMEAHPDESQLYGWHGAVLIKMNHPDRAIQYFRKAAELSPAEPDYHSGLGYCLYFLGRFNEAINEFRITLSLDPVHVDALAGLGAAYTQTGDKDKAMGVYSELSEIDKDVADQVFRIINQ